MYTTHTFDTNYTVCVSSLLYLSVELDNCECACVFLHAQVCSLVLWASEFEHMCFASDLTTS